MSDSQIINEATPAPKDKNPYQPRINAIRKVIYAEEKRVKEKYPILEHQNFLGMTIFLSCLFSMATVAYFYITGALSLMFVIPLIAFFVSLLHELEHDLIHDLYFKEQKWVQHLMFATIWVSKVNANPWWRKPMHLKHHKTSGQVDDIEERLIGLGLPIGFRRILLALSALGVYTVIYGIAADSKKMNSLPGLNVNHVSLLNLPVLLPAHLALGVMFFPNLVSENIYNISWYICALFFFPNLLRQGCLVLISTGCHYFGDIPEKNVYFQNQVLNHWILYPLQAFCFNFGETHIIHHYVSRQTFYLRQMIAPACIAELKKQGVRFNDLEIYKRANRFYSNKDHHQQIAVGA